jgi:hypothetical protein
VAGNPIGWPVTPCMRSTLGWSPEVPWGDATTLDGFGGGLGLTAMKSVVGVDAADHGCSEDHESGLLSGEEGTHVALVG